MAIGRLYPPLRRIRNFLELTRAERIIAFIHKYVVVPEGNLQGNPMQLLPFQQEFIRDVYDNPKGTRRAYLSIGRRNGKTGLIAALLLAHIIGPEAVKNSQIASGARSREQAALVFNLAVKMINANPELNGDGDPRKSLVRIVPSSKKIIGLAMNVEFRALSAEAGSNHGMGLRLAILDEAGQVKGEHDPFVEALETSMGSYDDALLLAISTQAATDKDMFSVWLDDAGDDPQIVSHVYTAPEDCDLMDEDAWRVANPALGVFRSEVDLRQKMAEAQRLPSKENSVRWLFLNQRIDADAPFVSPGVWMENGGSPEPINGPVFAGLDLSEVSDLTAFVAISQQGNSEWGVHPTFWLPGDGLLEKARADRVPYDRWFKDGKLLTSPGRTVDYSFVAEYLRGFCDQHDVRRIAFDRWNFRHLRPWLEKAGFRDEELEGDSAIFKEMGQGFASMSPALRDLEAALLEGKLRHGAHPVLEMCARNAVVEADAAGNRKLTKKKSRGRIDGMVSLAMALSVAVDDRKEGGSMDDYFAALSGAA